MIWRRETQETPNITKMDPIFVIYSSHVCNQNHRYFLLQLRNVSSRFFSSFFFSFSTACIKVLNLRIVRLVEGVKSIKIHTNIRFVFFSSLISADSYQYQLQSMWQKCWSTNQSLVHNLRFRERGPLKSWRPETMAEAILSVLKEGLSLSQAARKYDIPYPTFVLYANRVHNMLGPSVDGGSGKYL